MDILKDVITIGATATVVLTIIAKLLPNAKVYGYGFSFGEWLNAFGTSKVGSKTWERVEDFIINSVGQLVKGIRDGLNYGEKEENEEQNNVRV